MRDVGNSFSPLMCLQLKRVHNETKLKRMIAQGWDTFCFSYGEKIKNYVAARPPLRTKNTFKYIMQHDSLVSFYIFHAHT